MAPHGSKARCSARHNASSPHQLNNHRLLRALGVGPHLSKLRPPPKPREILPSSINVVTEPVARNVLLFHGNILKYLECCGMLDGPAANREFSAREPERNLSC